MDINSDIKSIYEESNNIESSYKNLVESYISKGTEIEKLTNNSFVLSDNILINKEVLKHMILDSDLCKSLELNNNTYTLSELKAHLALYSLEHDTSLLEKVLELYELGDKVSSIKQKYMTFLLHSLNNIFKDNRIFNYKEKGIIDKNGKTTIEQVLKSKEELYYDQSELLDRADELYVNESLINRDNYLKLKQLVNKVFNSYKYGNGKLSIKNFKEKEVVNQKTI